MTENTDKNSCFRSRFAPFLYACILWSVAFSSHAQSATPEQEYSRYLTAAQSITPLSSLGDQVSLRDGTLSFRQVDVELPGIGPTIRIVRTFRVVGRIGRIKDTSGNSMGEWELALPRLKTLTNGTTGTLVVGPKGWQVGDGSDARCTEMDRPGMITRPKVDPVEAEAWWGGYQLVEDSGEEETVLGGGSYSSSPAHVATTKGYWLITCLASTSNGLPGEAFQAIAPDGTRYWLDHLVYKTAPSAGSTLNRKYGSMLVTRIEDRFGNWVAYHYSATGILDAIDASDGRRVTLANNGYNITSATVVSAAGNRTWTYQYSTQDAQGALTSMVLPDGTSWQFSLDGLFYIGMPLQTSGNCNGAVQNDGLTGTTRTGSITSPSGATATYALRTLHIGRSYIPMACFSPVEGYAPYAEIPKDSWGYALSSKTVSGPGLSQATWTYSYSSGNSSWSSDCSGGCATTVWTDVTNPDGVRNRSIFSNRFDGSENLLLRTETYPAQPGAAVQAADTVYAISPPDETNSPYPWRSVGFDFTPRSNWQVSERWTPAQSTTVTQDGRAFQRVVNSYDMYARPLSVTKSSAPSP